MFSEYIQSVVIPTRADFGELPRTKRKLVDLPIFQVKGAVSMLDCCETAPTGAERDGRLTMFSQHNTPKVKIHTTVRAERLVENDERKCHLVSESNE